MAGRVGIALTCALLAPLTLLGATPARSIPPRSDARRPDARRPDVLRLFALRPVAPRPVAPRPVAPRPVAPIHDVHLTYSRVVVDGGSILWRVRLFRDDLERALQSVARNPALTATTPGADSVFARYFNAEVPLSANGRVVTAKVLESGRDAEVTSDEMYWYLLEFAAPAPVKTLTVRVGLLFAHFSDQRNIVTVLKMPGERRQSMYFVRDDAKGQTIDFQ